MTKTTLIIVPLVAVSAITLWSFVFFLSGKIIKKIIRMIAAFVPLIFIVVSLQAQEYPTMTYLVYRVNFPQNRYCISISTDNAVYNYFIKTGIGDIKAAKGQPFRIVSYKIISDKYGVVTFTPTKDSIVNLFKAMEKRGFVKKLSEQGITTYYDGARGGYITTPYNNVFSSYPADFYGVQISSK